MRNKGTFFLQKTINILLILSFFLCILYFNPKVNPIRKANMEQCITLHYPMPIRKDLISLTSIPRILSQFPS